MYKTNKSDFGSVGRASDCCLLKVEYNSRTFGFGGVCTTSDIIKITQIVFQKRRKVTVFGLNLNTNQTNLASEASGRQVLVCCLNLITNQANLASDAAGRKVLDFYISLNTNQETLPSKTSGRKVIVF